MKKILKDSIILLVLLILSAVAVFILIERIRPDTSENYNRNDISLGIEKKIGKLVRNQILIDDKIAESPLTEKALIKIKNFLLENARDFPFDINIILINSNIINAFALPGGTIIIYSGVFKIADSPEEIIAVIAHEMGHIYYRDSYNSIIKSIGRQALLSIITGGNSDLITEIINQLLTTKYSRQAEERADNFALELLSEKGIDPIYLALFFEQMDKLVGTDNTSFALQYFSTHPSGEERIKKAREASAQFTSPKALPDFKWELIKKEQPSFFN